MISLLTGVRVDRVLSTICMILSVLDKMSSNVVKELATVLAGGRGV